MSTSVKAYRPAKIIKSAQLRPRKNAKLPEKRWNPTDWRPEYEQVLAMTCRGLSNIYIAEKFNLTPQHISNIINSEQGKLIQKEFIQGIRQFQVEQGEELIGGIQNKAIQRIQEMFENDELAQESPFGVHDRAVGFLKAIGKFQSEKVVENQTTTINNTTILKQETVLNQLNIGLGKANEARRLNSGVTGDSIN